jgi:hypothetical protein
MSNVSDVSIKMRHSRSTTLQLAAKRGKARANTRHAGFEGLRELAAAAARTADEAMMMRHLLVSVVPTQNETV